MISQKQITKLQFQILKDIYAYQSKNNSPYSSTVLYACNLNSKIDEHDIDIVVNTLLVNNFIQKSKDDIEDLFSITPNGITYLDSQSNKLQKWFSNNFFHLLDLAIALIGAITGILALILKD